MPTQSLPAIAKAARRAVQQIAIMLIKGKLWIIGASELALQLSQIDRQ